MIVLVLLVVVTVSVNAEQEKGKNRLIIQEMESKYTNFLCLVLLQCASKHQNPAASCGTPRRVTFEE